MKSESNRRKHGSVSGTFNLGENTQWRLGVVVFFHDESDLTMVAFVLEAAKSGQSVVCLLSDDTDVFALPAYWVYWADLQCKVQVELWDGTTLDINAICADLGQKCLQVLGMHGLSGYDTTSYFYVKGRVSAQNTMVSGNYQDLDTIGDVGSTHIELMNAVMLFFVALYSQPPGLSMALARYNIFTKTKRNPKVLALYLKTSANLMQRNMSRSGKERQLWRSSRCVWVWRWNIYMGQCWRWSCSTWVTSVSVQTTRNIL